VLSGAKASVANEKGVAFRKGLGDMSFVEGKNVLIEYRWANFRYERLSAMAADPRQLSCLSNRRAKWIW
jgi:putative ABC transport system substrate-binding protein